MDSPFATIFEAMMARIQSQVPEIKYIDQDLGQLEGNSLREAVAFPCLLFDFKNWTADDLGSDVQMLQGNVIAKLGFAQFNDTSNINDPLWRTHGLSYWDLEWKVNKALHGWSPGNDFGTLSRRTMDSENRPRGIRVKPLVYALEFEDYSTDSDTTQVMTPLPTMGITPTS